MKKTWLSKLPLPQRKKVLAIGIGSAALVLVCVASLLLVLFTGGSGTLPVGPSGSGSASGTPGGVPSGTASGSDSQPNSTQQGGGTIENGEASSVTAAFVEKERVDISTQKPAFAAGMPTAKIAMENGLSRLYIDGKATAPILFFGNSDFNNPKGVTTSQAGYAGQAGIHLHSIIVNLNYTTDIGNLSETAQQLLYNHLHRSVKSITDGDPDAKILLRVSVLMRPTADTKKGDVIRFKNDGTESNAVSMAADVFNEESSKRLAHMVDYISSHEELASHIIGYHLDNQEWFQYAYRENGQDFSTANNEKFAQWLAVKYKTDEALQKAWGSDSVKLSTVDMPLDLPANLFGENYADILFYGTETQKYVDYHQYVGDLTVARISNLSRIIKERTENRAIVISFYGYQFELYSSISGHYNLNWLLADENIDGFAGPVTYKDRNTGSYDPKSAICATSAFMSTVDSIQRNGKLWFQESDQRTFINHTGAEVTDTFLAPITSLEDIYQVHKRELGDSIIHGNGLWAMDLMAQGWLDDQTIWTNLSKLAGLYSAYQNGCNRAAQFDVALVVDEYSLNRMANHGLIGNELLGEMQLNLYHAGLSTCYVQLKDVLAGKVDDAKLYIITSAFDMTDAQIAQLQKQLHRDGKTTLFMYNFGVLSTEQAKALTGMDFAEGSVDSTRLTLSEQSAVPGLKASSHTAVTARAMTVTGGQTATLGTYSDGSVGFAIKKTAEYTTIYFGDSVISTDNLKAIAKACGIHVYTDTKDVFMANQNLAVLHTTSAGTKTVSFGRKVDVYDYFENKWYTGVDSVSLPMEKGKTKYLFFGEKSDIESWKLPAY